MGQDHSTVSAGTPPETLTERSLAAVAQHIKSGNVRRIVVMTGAGISTAAGIPDFRSPDTGLYANLARLNLPEPEAVFDLLFFKENPKPFYVLAKDLYPGKFFPTISHVFISMLAKKGLLHQLFTQNIDCLERAAGIPPELIVEAHGSFADQRCIDCKTPYPENLMREHVERAEVPLCIDKKCGGLVKPDIVFFHEALPPTFYDRIHTTSTADLAIVMGTSLMVHPFAGLPDQISRHAPRVLFNLDRVGSLGSRADDVLELGDCDTGVRKLADELGWREELESEWRKLVGDEEAERQMQGTGKRAAAVLEDEVSRLADDLDRGVRLQDFEETNDASSFTESQEGETYQETMESYQLYKADEEKARGYDEDLPAAKYAGGKPEAETGATGGDAAASVGAADVVSVNRGSVSTGEPSSEATAGTPPGGNSAGEGALSDKSTVKDGAKISSAEHL